MDSTSSPSAVVVESIQKYRDEKQGPERGTSRRESHPLRHSKITAKAIFAVQSEELLYSCPSE